MLEEDEAELELQKQLEKGRRLRQLQQLQQLRDSGEKVSALEAGRRWALASAGLGPSVTRVSVGTCPYEHVCQCAIGCSTCVPIWIFSFA